MKPDSFHTMECFSDAIDKRQHHISRRKSCTVTIALSYVERNMGLSRSTIWRVLTISRRATAAALFLLILTIAAAGRMRLKERLSD
jgi:hypothetical protein